MNIQRLVLDNGTIRLDELIKERDTLLKSLSRNTAELVATQTHLLIAQELSDEETHAVVPHFVSGLSVSESTTVPTPPDVLPKCDHSPGEYCWRCASRSI